MGFNIMSIRESVARKSFQYVFNEPFEGWDTLIDNENIFIKQDDNEEVYFSSFKELYDYVSLNGYSHIFYLDSECNVFELEPVDWETSNLDLLQSYYSFGIGLIEDLNGELQD